MLTQISLRWRLGRSSYRPAREAIDTSAFEVAPLHDDTTAKAFVLLHHYSGSYPAARFRFGLFTRGVLVGVAVFSHPASNAVLDRLPGDGLERCELGRLVLFDGVGGNAESWMIARCFELLRRDGIVGVVSFSDPVPRTRADGVQIFPGHVGTIYQASNAVYTGRTKAETLRLLPDGNVLHGRALAKLRSRTKGWRYVAARLESAGAVPLGDDENAAAWAARWTSLLTRPLRHGGNHRYLFGLDRAARRELARREIALPYPKLDSGGTQ